MLIKEVTGLTKWFKERWVDISRKVGGKHPPCGASAKEREKYKDGFKRSYPKCVPASVAAKMTAAEKKNATLRKRRAVHTKMRGNSPVFVSTKPKK